MRWYDVELHLCGIAVPPTCRQLAPQPEPRGRSRGFLAHRSRRRGTRDKLPPKPLRFNRTPDLAPIQRPATVDVLALISGVA